MDKPPDVPPFVEQWSAITPNDFGLQAGYYPEEKGSAQVTFRPVLGWITVTSRDSLGKVSNQFHAVVMGPFLTLTPAVLLPRYLGVFPKTMAPHEAWAFSKQWRPDDKDEPNAQASTRVADPQNVIQFPRKPPSE